MSKLEIKQVSELTPQQAEEYNALIDSHPPFKELLGGQTPTDLAIRCGSLACLLTVEGWGLAGIIEFRKSPIAENRIAQAAGIVEAYELGHTIVQPEERRKNFMTRMFGAVLTYIVGPNRGAVLLDLAVGNEELFNKMTALAIQAGFVLSAVSGDEAMKQLFKTASGPIHRSSLLNPEGDNSTEFVFINRSPDLPRGEGVTLRDEQYYRIVFEDINSKQRILEELAVYISQQSGDTDELDSVDVDGVLNPRFQSQEDLAAYRRWIDDFFKDKYPDISINKASQSLRRKIMVHTPSSSTTGQ